MQSAHAGLEFDKVCNCDTNSFVLVMPGIRVWLCHSDLDGVPQVLIETEFQTDDENLRVRVNDVQWSKKPLPEGS